MSRSTLHPTPPRLRRASPTSPRTRYNRAMADVDSTSSPQEEASQTPAPAEEPTATPPEAATAPTEPEVTQSEQKPAEAQTAQIPVSEPLPPEPPPSPEATDGRSEPTSEPAAPAVAEAMAGRRDLLVKARATIQDRKAKKLEKILEALNAKGPTTLKLRRAGKISNDEVEKLLHVSDATATRYLSALEKQGKIKQVGRTGKAVQYEKS